MKCVARSWGKVAASVLLVTFSQVLFADSKTASDEKPFVSNEEIVVLQPTDPFPVTAQMLHTIDVGEQIGRDCTYSQLLAYAKASASKSNANIIKITELKANNRSNVYDRLTATLYKAENPKLYEKEITWSKDRKLTWDDFRGSAHAGLEDGRVAAATFCGFGFETNAVSEESNKVKVLVYNSFYTDKSWFQEGLASDAVLKHEQCHFDICELYTRKLRERLNTADVTAANMNVKLKGIYNQVREEYKERQERYEHETEHGLIADRQHNWEVTIARELGETERWAE